MCPEIATRDRLPVRCGAGRESPRTHGGVLINATRAKGVRPVTERWCMRSPSRVSDRHSAACLGGRRPLEAGNILRAPCCKAGLRRTASAATTKNRVRSRVLSRKCDTCHLPEKPRNSVLEPTELSAPCPPAVPSPQSQQEVREAFTGGGRYRSISAAARSGSLGPNGARGKQRLFK